MRYLWFGLLAVTGVLAAGPVALTASGLARWEEKGPDAAHHADAIVLGRVSPYYPALPRRVVKLTARAQRSGKWWAVEVVEVPGLFTQAHRLDQVADMVEEAATLFGHRGPFKIEVVPVLAEDLTRNIHAARALTIEAGQVQRQAAARSREVVERLRAEGLTVRDVASVLSISPQRVSQLLQTGPGSAVA